MRFYCDETGNIGRFNFEHKGYGLKMYQYDATAFKEERMHMDMNDIPKVEMVFNDVREIESLMIMLNRFRKECLRTDGVWNPVRLIPDDTPQREVDPFKGFSKEEIDRLFSGINKKEES